MHPNQPVSIIIADDHQIFRSGFKNVIASQKDLSLAFVAEASNGLELVEQVKLHQPHIVITDIRMPQMDGIRACHLIKENYPLTKVIALSMFYDEGLVLDMQRAGAVGYLQKNAEQAEVLGAIKMVSEGFTYFKRDITAPITAHINGHHSTPQKASIVQFSNIEIDLIKLICKQMTNKEIAHSLALSKRTIEDYRKKIQERINAKNAVGIVLYALENGIVKLNEL